MLLSLLVPLAALLQATSPGARAQGKQRPCPAPTPSFLTPTPFLGCPRKFSLSPCHAKLSFCSWA